MSSARLRSVLYVPASNERALARAPTLAADAQIKMSARESACALARARSTDAQTLAIRVNAVGTPWHEQDLAAAVAAEPDAIVLPKVAAAGDVVEAERVLQGLGAAPGLRLWAMMETPAAVLRAGEVAAAGERLEVLVMGTNDLLAELHGAERPDRRPLETSMALCVLAARAAGRMILDGVYNDVRDAAGFEAECRVGRDLGFDGKTLIHPGQIEACNRLYSPAGDEIEHAQRVIAVFERARESGAGVATLDGRLVEALHVQAARRILAAADRKSST